MASEIKEKRFRYWLLMLCYVNQRYGGIQAEEIFDYKRKELDITFSNLLNKLSELEKEGILQKDSKPGYLTSFYVLSDKGNKEVRGLIRKKDYEFYRVLLLLPAEYELRWRIFNVERFIFYSSLSFLLYAASYNFIKFGFPQIGIILIPVFAFFLPFAAFYLGEIISFIFVGFLTNLFGQTYSFLDKKSKSLSYVISTIFVLLALIISFFISNWAFWSEIVAILIGFIFKDYLNQFFKASKVINIILQKIKPLFRVD